MSLLNSNSNLLKTICGYKNEDRLEAWDLISIRHLSLDSYKTKHAS